MKHLLAIALAVASLSAAQGTATFTGVITDDMCARGDHSGMRMGPTDAECTIACVHAHAAAYVLFGGGEVYLLSDQKMPEAFAGQRVRVTGVLDAKTKTIRVESMAAVK
jgi:Protein of unknown function (DUF5818)